MLDIQINLTPLHVMDHAGAGDGQRIKPKRVTDDVTEGDVLPSLIDQPEKANHILCFGDAGPRCRDVDSELLLEARNGL